MTEKPKPWWRAFVAGAGSILEIWPPRLRRKRFIEHVYRPSPSVEDWNRVCKDMRKAMADVDAEIKSVRLPRTSEGEEGATTKEPIGPNFPFGRFP